MRTLAAAVAALFFTVSGASAQYFDWSRFYAGPFAGFGFGQSTFTAPAGATTFGTAGFSAGVLVGTTQDFNGFVVGGELDAQAGGMTGSATCPASTDKCATSITWLSSLRAKADIATPVGLFYGTVGPALGGVEAQVAPSGGLPRAVNQTRIGYTAGLGFEMPISDKVTLGGEYAYSELWKLEETGTLYGGQTSATAQMHAIRAGARFSF